MSGFMTGDVVRDPPPAKKAGEARRGAWALLVLTIVLLGGANVSLDLAAKHHRTFGFELLFSPQFIIGVVCLGVAFLCYVRALASLPLSVAYPVMTGMSIVISAVASVVWLDAPLSPLQVMGLIAVFLGVSLLSWARER
jgi:multidrug transporter EmrE-like cation transporter